MQIDFINTLCEISSLTLQTPSVNIVKADLPLEGNHDLFIKPTSDCVKLLFAILYGDQSRYHARTKRESLATLGAFAGTAAVRCDVASPAITGAKPLRNGLENVTFTGCKI